MTEPRGEAPLGARFRRALAYAARIHGRQFRKGTARPYIAHLLGVASTVLTHGGNEDEAIAALLHDAVEDQGGKPRLLDIRRKFGTRVADIVQACTDSYTDPKPPWHQRKLDYLEHLRSANASVHLVSAADKLYNAREIIADLRRHPNAVWSRFRGGKDGTVWYYRQVAEILRPQGPGTLVEELDRAVAELEQLAHTRI